MVNTVGLRKAAVLETLAKAAGVEFKPMILNGSSMSPCQTAFGPLSMVYMLFLTSTLMMGSTRLHLTMRWAQVQRRRSLMS